MCVSSVRDVSVRVCACVRNWSSFTWIFVCLCYSIKNELLSLLNPIDRSSKPSMGSRPNIFSLIFSSLLHNFSTELKDDFVSQI